MAETKAVIFSDGKFQAIDNSGNVVPYGKLYFFEASTGNEVVTYTTSTMEIENTHPIILTASGKGDVYLADGQYDVTLQDKNGATVWTINNYIPAGGQIQLEPVASIPTREEFVGFAGSTLILEDTPSTTVTIHKNGLLLSEDDYALDGRTITFDTPLIVTDFVIVEFTAVIAAGVNTGLVYDVAEMADLLTLDTTYGTVNVPGYYVENDGGGGIFNWDAAADKADANGGTSIDPSVSLVLQGTGTGLGCWIRQYTGAINVKWFGAKGDGVTDDATAIQTAIDARIGDVFAPAGTFACEAPIELRHNTIFRGAGHYDHPDANATTILGVHIGSAVILAQLTLNAVLTDMVIKGDATTTPKTGIAHGRSSSASSGNSTYHNLQVKGSFSEAGVYMIASEGNWLKQCDINITGGGAKYCFYTAQSDLLSVASFTASSNIWGRVEFCQFAMNDTVASSACVFMDASDLTTDWVFENNYFIVGNGYVAFFQSVVAAAATRGQISFRNNGAEVAAGSTAVAMFRFELVSFKNFNGMIFENNRLVSTPVVKAISTNDKVVLKGMKYISGANADVSNMATDIEAQGLTSCYIETQGTVTVLDPARHKDNLIRSAVSLDMVSQAGEEAFNVVGSTGVNRLRLYESASNIGTVDSEGTAIDIIADHDGTPGGVTVSTSPERAVHPTITDDMYLGRSSHRWKELFTNAITIGTTQGVSGTFTTTDGKTVTVTGGLITAIV